MLVWDNCDGCKLCKFIMPIDSCHGLVLMVAVVVGRMVSGFTTTYETSDYHN